MKDTIKKWLGTPYEHNGRSTNGVDCLGLVSQFLAENGINVPDGDGRTIKKNWYEYEPERFIEGLEREGDRIESIDELQQLDIVCFKVDNQHITHSGVMVDNDRFIHILEERQVAVDRLHRFWRKKFECGYRIERR